MWNSWADQRDGGGDALAKYKDKVEAGLGKTKSGGKFWLKEMKIWTILGLKWVKKKYNKTKH